MSWWEGLLSGIAPGFGLARAAEAGAFTGGIPITLPNPLVVLDDVKKVALMSVLGGVALGSAVLALTASDQTH